MPPSEFWDSHPEETIEWILQNDRRDVELAWQIALMNGLGRAGKIPKTPHDYFKERQEEWTDEQLVARAKNLAQAQEAERERKKLRRPDKTTMRPA